MASDNSKAFRRYQAGVERALALFDAKNEWADYIAFLSRLLKALQASPPDSDIPSKDVLAKYLAECLSPTLPAGVHQKALEVYDCIFGILGRDGLSKDLPLYHPGFADTLTFASLATRPWFLTLYDDHILGLHPDTLRLALNAIVSSLLPGIEEENSEDFDKILGTINKIREVFAASAEEGIFWQNLFLVSIEDAGLRVGALVYMVRYLPKIGAHQRNGNASTTSVEDVVTPEPGLLFRCFATGLQDEQPLVQRGFLDLLVTHLPLNSPTLQKTESKNDLVVLVSAAMSIVLKRDMSLSRRLWTWFFGNDEKGDGDPMPSKSPVDAPRRQSLPTSTHYADFGLQAVTDAIDGMLRQSPIAPVRRARPYRLVVSLMDRSAIGGPVVDSLFQKLITNLKQYQTSAPTQEAFDEVFRSANVLFDSIEPRRLAKYFVMLISASEWDLLEFIVLNFGLDDTELGRAHLPAIAAYLASICTRELEAGNSPHVRQIAMILDTVLTFVPVQLIKKSKTPSKVPSKAIVSALKDSYLDNKKDIVSPDDALVYAANEIIAAIGPLLRSLSDLAVLDHLVSAFGSLVSVLPYDPRVRYAGLVSSIEAWAELDLQIQREYFALSSAVSVLLNILTRGPSISHADEELAVKLVPKLARNWWAYLQPSSPQYHVESVELFWNLQAICPDKLLVDSTLMELLADDSHGPADHPSVNFGTLWAHTKTVPRDLATNGSSQESYSRVAALLDQAAIFIVDRSIHDAAWVSWLGALSSLDLHFQAVLKVIDERASRIREKILQAEISQEEKLQNGDEVGLLGGALQEESLVDLYRLRQLVQVARSSATLSKELTGKQILVRDKRQNLVENIMQLAEKAFVLHQTDEGSAVVAVDIFNAIDPRSLPGSRKDLDDKVAQADSATSSGDRLVEVFVTQLPKTTADSNFQRKVLDALHNWMSNRPDAAPPVDLLPVLMGGIASPMIDKNLDKWISLLCNSIPTYSDAIFFANLLKLTACFCNRIQAFFSVNRDLFDPRVESHQLSGTGFRPQEAPPDSFAKDPERSITNLLSGLEYVLARAHTKIVETGRPASSTGGQEPSGTGAGRSRTLANHRLTVVLCMQDAIKVCCQMWFWQATSATGPSSNAKSFSYMSSRLRAKTRRILEHLFEAEPQECLETVMGIWVEKTKSATQPGTVINLLQTLDGARPKFMLPAIFNALYSRTNPNVLDSGQRSTLSVDASAVELVAFLVEYVNRLEDDLLEEIWNDCLSFTRDVLANPMPHRQLLLRLLDFQAALCAKMENTTFAIFTIKPGGMDEGSEAPSKSASRLHAGKGVDILLSVLPIMAPVLSEGDRISTVFQGISANITGPALRSRSFPQTLNNNVLSLYLVTAKASANSKVWRKDLIDAFNDARLFDSSVTVAKTGWIPIVRQLSSVDRNIFPEVIARFVAPATAGIMFGVGASTARAEADKTTKTNLRRLCLLLMAHDQDFYASIVGLMLARIKELLTATPATSPSSSTRGEIYLLFRAMMLSLAEENLMSIWPDLISEFRKVFEDMNGVNTLTPYTQLQAAKLLDLLLLLKPRGFQRRKWLFVTDTIDAIYPPADLDRVAAADLVQSRRGSGVEHVESQQPSTSTTGLRRPWLAGMQSPSALGPFYRQLSIRAFEATYSLEGPDVAACREDLIADLFSSDAEAGT
ncbi:Protein dopey [Cyphellophora attinorum]|uniref:Protein dopey n=1 Tax=Cyphellophora attinorum TaxID=1664694 RepID=A0A0N0NM66_9EURO|nr:Protein dopey [Phialophora attinorum]KPI39998.1 Protein dopey [Phialophora attinorum]